MASLTTVAEMTRSGRNLISKLMKGTAVNGISHAVIGSGTGGAYSAFGTNKRVGNNMEITGNNPVVVHNDIPIFNFGPNGLVGFFYFLEDVNNQRDLSLSFGPDHLGTATLKANLFNHLFMIHRGQSGAFGIADLLNVPTASAAVPTDPPDRIAYLGYIETDLAVRTINNPARMFNEIAQIGTPQIEFLGDRAINGPTSLEVLQPSLADSSAEPNPSLMIRARVSAGVNDTVREIAILGDNGSDIVAWAPVEPSVAITIGQGIFVRWALAF